MVQYHNFLLLFTSNLEPTGQLFFIPLPPYCFKHLESTILLFSSVRWTFPESTYKWDCAVFVYAYPISPTPQAPLWVTSSQITSFNLFMFKYCSIIHELHFPHPFMGWWSIRWYPFHDYSGGCCKEHGDTDVSSNIWISFPLNAFLVKGLLALWGFVIYIYIYYKPCILHAIFKNCTYKKEFIIYDETKKTAFL